MITKQCQFSGKDENGIYVHILRPGYDNRPFLKEAQISTPTLNEIINVSKILPRVTNGDALLLMSALGADEYWGKNSNGDAFPESSLIHVPPNWNSLPLDQQRLIGAKWEWGYPTFYNAHAFQHHTNKDIARAFGDVEYSYWDPKMHRVLLIVRINRAKAVAQGADSVLDKIENGEFCDVSMACRVPFDLCSRCCDWSRITGNPKVDLANHKKSPIRGLSLTTGDYCSHLRFELGKIHPDGVAVKMINLHPKFFDISVVFIGADRTSKILAKLAGKCPIRQDHPMCKKGCWDCDIPSSHVHEVWERDTDKMMKVAFDKGSQYEDDFTSPAEEASANSYFSNKRSTVGKVAEITKDVVSNFGNTLPSIDEQEVDLPKSIIPEMADDIPNSLNTAGSLGIILKPHEFQRTVLLGMKRRDIADDLDRMRLVFRRGLPPSEDFCLGDEIIPRILEALIPIMQNRSALGPPLRRRMITIKITKVIPSREQIAEPLLDKIGSAYSSYRHQLLAKIATLVPEVINSYPNVLAEIASHANSPKGKDLVKVGENVVQSLCGYFPTAYLNRAYLPGPVSSYVDRNCDFSGLLTLGALAERGQMA